MGARSMCLVIAILCVALVPDCLRAGESCPTCTGDACGSAWEPACRATWDEKKAKTPAYSLSCEYAGVRDRDPWHAPPPECRRHPPCGQVIVKKRLYLVAGEETTERVPKYDVRKVPTPCECAACRGAARSVWRPLAWLHEWLSW